METVPILIRKDGMPIRYLVVDDSVFAGQERSEDG